MVLVVIDCQPRYLPFGSVLEAVETEVKRAREAGTPIIVLEFHTAEPTYEHLIEMLAGYDKWERRRKTTFGGGREVIDTCRTRDWSTSMFRLVGAETYCCVAETAEQLFDSLPDSNQEVVGNACFDKYVGGPFPRHENIRWV